LKVSLRISLLNQTEVVMKNQLSVQIADMARPRQFRSIWISDLHLGTAGCKAETLLEFLKAHESDFLYLTGDIVDGWRLKSRWFWPQSHNNVVQELLLRKGKKTIVPGNHDAFIRDYAGATFGDIEILLETEHTTAAGEKLLVTHGDSFDCFIEYAHWLGNLGAWAYDFAVVLNNQLNRIRRSLGLSYWSLAGFLKLHLKEALQYINNFEEILAGEAKNRGYDGVVCGHIHHANLRFIDGILYCNDGDWVDSCSALVEHFDGRLELLTFKVEHAIREPESTNL
jgi:UDP-2,3-diacylglucosamine pyrophosphatase LpxH